MTTVELRVLYLLQKHDGRAKLWQLSQAMARVKKANRERALADLEELGLLSSAAMPLRKGKGGTGGLVFWLTDAGRLAVADMIERGELQDPATSSQGRLSTT